MSYPSLSSASLSTPSLPPSLSPQMPFEGPEKRLYLSFTPTSPSSGALRAMSGADLDAVLCAASCSVLSRRNNEHLDAYLLSESSLFVSDHAIMFKTCGSTTLLRALPCLLGIAREQHLAPAVVQYSRVHFQFPSRQVYPHDSYSNEVAYLDSVLGTCGIPLSLGASDWNVYIAQPALPRSAPPRAAPPLPQTLEVFMFDLDPAAMSHYIHNSDSSRAGARFALTHTTVRSRISSFLSNSACVDAYNFLPCGYSLNAIDAGAYVTIHVSPEPQASYVSFESTANTTRLADLVATVVKVFRPSRFTVSFVGSGGCAALRANPESPVYWSKLSKLLGCTFSYTSDPVLLPACVDLWVATATFIQKGFMQNDVVSSVCAKIGARTLNPVRELVTARFNAHITSESSTIRVAREMVAMNREREHPMFVVDLEKVIQRAIRVRKALSPRFTFRYAVRCNSDRAVLMILNLLGWSFEAVSMMEVIALQECGVKKENIAFVSPLLTPDVVCSLEQIGMLSLVGKPDERVLDAIKRSGVALEIRVPDGAVDESLQLCESVLPSCGNIASFAVDCEPDLRILSMDQVVAGLKQTLKTITAVIRQLPPDLVKGVTISIPELSMKCKDDEVLWRVGQLLGLCESAEIVSLDVGRWVVGPSTSLVVSVIGHRVRFSGALQREIDCDHEEELSESHHYYLNDGVYGALSFIIMERSSRGSCSGVIAEPEVIPHDQTRISLGKGYMDGDEVFESTLFGPTCDALDWIWKGKLPKLEVGDMLMFRNMGAYAASAVSTFNGFAKSYETAYVMGADSVHGDSVYYP